MKIGFNYKAIKNFVMTNIDQIDILFANVIDSIQNDVDNLGMRITALETSSSSSNTYTLKMYNVNDDEVKNININIIDNNAFINFNYNVTFNCIDTLAVGYNLVKLGTFNLGNNKLNICCWKTKSVIV